LLLCRLYDLERQDLASCLLFVVSNVHDEDALANGIPVCLVAPYADGLEGVAGDVVVLGWQDDSFAREVGAYKPMALTRAVVEADLELGICAEGGELGPTLPGLGHSGVNATIESV
jgi:hypothetical protein